MYKEIIKGKSIIICDICGEEIEETGYAKLNLKLEQSWYHVLNTKTYHICKRHRKETLNFIKELKNKINKQEVKNGQRKNKK